MSQLDSYQDNSSAERVLSSEILRDLIEVRAERKVDGKSPYPEDELFEAKSILQAFQDESTEYASKDLESILEGEIGTLDQLKDTDEITQQFNIDSFAMRMLFGVMKYNGESDENAAKYAYILYYHYCREDEEVRKFSAFPEAYRQKLLKNAIDEFDKGDVRRWKRRKRSKSIEEVHHWKLDGDYGDPIYDTIQALLLIACTSFDREFIICDEYELDYSPSADPIVALDNGEFEKYSSRSFDYEPLQSGGFTDSENYRYVPKEVLVNVASEIDDRSKRSYKNAIRNLRKRGGLKWAQIREGVDYRIYPDHFPDPEGAEKIKFEGEEYAPEPETPDQPESPEMPEEPDQPTIMTDGGVDIEEAPHRHHERREGYFGDSREKSRGLDSGSDQAASDSSERGFNSEGEDDRPPPP